MWIDNNTRTDIECLEVCVYCFKIFREASGYIQHVGNHKEADSTKDSYMAQICTALRKRADQELDRLEDGSQSNGVGRLTMKRALQAEEEETGAPEVQRLKMTPDLSQFLAHGIAPLTISCA